MNDKQSQLKIPEKYYSDERYSICIKNPRTILVMDDNVYGLKIREES